VEKVKNAYTCWIGNLQERILSEDLGIEGRTILQCTLRKLIRRVRNDSMELRIEAVSTFCEHDEGREVSGSHGGQYERDRLLGYNAVLSRTSRPTFQRCVLPHRPDGGNTHL
jgi:hypothetical protein